MATTPINGIIAANAAVTPQRTPQPAPKVNAQLLQTIIPLQKTGNVSVATTQATKSRYPTNLPRGSLLDITV